MQHVGDDGENTERARKRCRVGEAGSEIAPIYTTLDGDNVPRYEEVQNDLEYTHQYSNPLFPRVQSGGAHGQSANRGEAPRTYRGETTVGDSAILVQGDITHNYYHLRGPEQDRYHILLASLTFDRMDARLRNVAMPLTNTCQWLFKHQLFCRWIEKNHAQEHHGFFWIKGKPGSGKSTVMKELVTWAQRTWNPQVVLTYFFNARSPQNLEKSTLGLYRSLLHQLLSVHPNGRQLFVERFILKIRPGKGVEEWSQVELQNFLIELITRTCMPNVNIFIDALDEGNTDDNRQMITFLEQLTRSSFASNVYTRVCLSSRHYPHISVRQGLSLVLEEQFSHTIDIDNYIRSELVSHESPQMDKLRREVRDRSAGVFLWVVLVIPMLNRGFDSGKSVAAMRQELHRIPQDLRNMFIDILSRDPDDLDECRSLLRWILFSQRPLTVAEAYDAVKQASLTTEVREEADLHDNTLVKYLLHCSRGLAEVTGWRVWLLEMEMRKVVQFIHETVREFLLDEREPDRISEAATTRYGVPLGFRADTCHLEMAEECMRYVLCLSRRSPLTKEVLKLHPLAEYAARYWQIHLRACSTQSTQKLFDLAAEILTSWADHTLLNLLTLSAVVDGGPTIGDTAPPLCRAVHIGMPRLVSTLLSRGADMVAEDSVFDAALIVAAHHNLRDVLQVFFDHGADVNIKNKDGETALHRASAQGHEEILRMLLKHGASINHQDKHGETALYKAAKEGHEKIVQILASHFAKIDAQNRGGETALMRATDGRHEEIVQTLLDHGADINHQNKYGETALYRAAKWGHERVVEILIRHSAKIDIQRRDGETALMGATDGRFMKIVQILLEHGADVNLIASDEGTALGRAMFHDDEELVRLILLHGANVSAQDFSTQTVSWWLNIKSPGKLTKLLLEHGSDANGRNSNGDSLFWQAISRGRLMIAHMLLQNGVGKDDHGSLWQELIRSNEYAVRRFIEFGGNIDTQDENGQTALYRAVSEGRGAKVQLLLGLGADINFQCKRNKTVLSLAVFMENEPIMQMLLDYGSNTNTRDRLGRTALQFAVSKNNEKMVNSLLKWGADVNTRGDNGCTPLCRAAVEGHTRIVQLLLDHKANPDTELCTVRQFKGTVRRVLVLEGAVFKGHEEIMRLLLDHGASVHVPIIYQLHREGQWKVLTLLQLATMSGVVDKNEKIVQMLRYRGTLEAYPTDEEEGILKKHGSLLAQGKGANRV